MGGAGGADGAGGAGGGGAYTGGGVEGCPLGCPVFSPSLSIPSLSSIEKV